VTPAKHSSTGPDALEEYRSKRDPSATPEPVPARVARRRRGGTKLRFVVQEHHARALHWDFRLERDGVLVSWAIPKGLPTDPVTNHLAVHTEDHPLEYAAFEGKIPEGEYGGGGVSIWDSGTYETEKWSDREVMVILNGDRSGRAKGKFVLFKTKDRNWMIHRMDATPEGSVAMPKGVRPMLASPGDLPRRDDGWSYEFKWDGIRALVYVDGGRVRLESRNGNELTGSFPELRRLGEHLGSTRAVLDGEIIAFDDKGRPSFQLLQPRIHAAGAVKARRLAEAQPAMVVLFDLLYLDGEDLTGRPYVERRRRLEALGLDGGELWSVSPRFSGPGADVLEASRDQGLEGLVAKRDNSPYRAGRRTPEWTKVKNTREQEAVIGGFTPGQGRRRNRIGSLLLGVPEGSELRYVGQVGTGFTEEMLDDLARRLEPLERATSPFADEVPTRYRKVARWVDPELVGEVAFSEWTSDGRLRQPSWRGLRGDKSASEVVRES
jgi:bifunctional non-homologous end joining protein LigD